MSCAVPLIVSVLRAPSARTMEPCSAIGSSTRFISEAETKRSWTTLTVSPNGAASGGSESPKITSPETAA